jgi:hypothetical protein
MSTELVATIKLESLTLADWHLIGTIRGYKPNWIYDTWAKAKGEAYLKQIGIDQWMAIATFLGRSKTWAVERYDEHRNGAIAEGEVA